MELQQLQQDYKIQYSRYSGGYTVANNLVPGYGYWIKLTGAGSINIPISLQKDQQR